MSVSVAFQCPLQPLQWDGAASAMFVALGPCRGETPPLPRPTTLKPWVQGCVHSRWLELQAQKNWNNQTSWSQNKLLSGWFQATNPKQTQNVLAKVWSHMFDVQIHYQTCYHPETVYSIYGFSWGPRPTSQTLIHPPFSPSSHPSPLTQPWTLLTTWKPCWIRVPFFKATVRLM